MTMANLLNVEELLEALPEELIHTLARLHDQPSDIVDITLSTLRYGSKTTLVQAEAIELAPDSEGGEQIGLTDYGRQLIEVCASKHGPTDADTEDAKEELEHARQKWTAKQPRP